MKSNKKVSITGGIATGKSTVAILFADLGAVILDADVVARQVVETGTPCWQALLDLLGPAYFDSTGQLERRKLRQRIIENPRCRKEVNSILHPAILSSMDRQWRERLQANPQDVVIFDIPLLFELNMEDRFDTVILVYARPDIQIDRLMKRDGLSIEEARQTLLMQLPIDEKRRRAHLIIDNSNGLDQTRVQVQAVWKQLKS